MAYLCRLNAEVKAEGNYFEIIRIPIFAVVLAPVFKRIYQTLFIKTWKTIIPLNTVKEVTTKPLDNGLETEVTLHLKSGRKKWYTFRNAEGQLEPFIEAVAAQTTLPAQMMGIDFHYQSISRGVVDSRDVVYFLSVVLFFLFITEQNLAKR